VSFAQPSAAGGLRGRCRLPLRAGRHQSDRFRFRRPAVSRVRQTAARGWSVQDHGGTAAADRRRHGFRRRRARTAAVPDGGQQNGRSGRLPSASGSAAPTDLPGAYVDRASSVTTAVGRLLALSDRLRRNRSVAPAPAAVDPVPERGRGPPAARTRPAAPRNCTSATAIRHRRG